MEGTYYNPDWLTRPNQAQADISHKEHYKRTQMGATVTRLERLDFTLAY